MSDEDDEFDENDMAAAIAAEQAERVAEDGGGNDDAFDEDDMAAAIAAEQAERAGSAGNAGRNGNGGGGGDAQTLGEALGPAAARNVAAQDIDVDLTAVLGVAEMKVSNLLKIGRGAVIELNRKVGDTVEIKVSGRAIARGEVVVVEDHLAVSITELVKK